MSDKNTLGRAEQAPFPEDGAAAEEPRPDSDLADSHLLDETTAHDDMFTQDTPPNGPALPDEPAHETTGATNEQTDERPTYADLENKVGKLEKKLRKYRTRIESVETMLGKVQAGLSVIDREGKLLYFNGAFERLHGLEDMRTKRKNRPKKNRFLQEKIHDPDVLELAKKVRRIDDTVSTTYQQSGGLGRMIHLVGHPLPEYASNVLLIFRDVTNEARLESIRKDFVANVSHELRTPLAAIMGYLETLLDPTGLDSKPQAQSFLGIVKRHADRLDALITDLLELSRLEAENVSSSDQYREPVNLAEIIQRPLEVVRRKAAAKPIHIHNDVPSDLPLVRGSKGPLEQVVINILTNAIKYSDPSTNVTLNAHLQLCGAEEVTLTEEGESADTKMIEISEKRPHENNRTVVLTIRDEGIGIEAEHLDRIFERFYRVDKDRSRAAGGTGLGLSIVKHIVQRCGGALFVESELGKGSTFSICLPTVGD